MDKEEILNHYNLLTYNINRLQYLSIYLKWIIDNIDDDTDNEEYLYISRKVEELSVIYSIQNDVIYRYKKEINKMLNNLNLEKELDLRKYLKNIEEEIIEIHKNKNA